MAAAFPNAFILEETLNLHTRLLIQAIMRKKSVMEAAVSGRGIIAIIKTEVHHLLTIAIAPTLLILQALTAHIHTALRVTPVLVRATWQICSVQAVIICTMILPAGPFIATAK